MSLSHDFDKAWRIGRHKTHPVQDVAVKPVVNLKKVLIFVGKS